MEQDISGAEETQSRSAFDLGFNLQCCRNLMYKAKEGGRRRKRSEGKKQGRREKNQKASSELLVEVEMKYLLGDLTSHCMSNLLGVVYNI